MKIERMYIPSVELSNAMSWVGPREEAGVEVDRGEEGEGMIRRLLNWLFRREEINGANRCPTYLFRWTLFSLPWFKVYLHKFVGEDWSRDLHDHPKRFISIGIWGRYTEVTSAGEREWRAPWIRTFPAEHIHRIRAGYAGSTWTIVIVGRASRQWGFWHDGQFIHWRKYVSEKGGPADNMKACEG